MGLGIQVHNPRKSERKIAHGTRPLREGWVLGGFVGIASCKASAVCPAVGSFSFTSGAT